MALHRIESYIAVPLIRRDGTYFGTLCALDFRPAQLSENDLEVFRLLASLIAFELEADDDQRRREVELEQVKRAEEALRQSEARFRGIFEGAPIGLVEIDLDHRFLKVNRALCELLRYTAQELTALSFADVTHPDDVAMEVGLAEQLFRGELPAYQLEKRCLKEDGQVLWVNVTTTVIRDQDGHPIRGLGMIQDISERRAIEQMQRTFTAMVAHELRNPLAALKGFAQLMQRRGMYNEQAAETIISQARHLDRLVDDLIDVAQLDAQRLDLRRSPTDLVALVKTITGQARATSQRHTLRVEAPRRRLAGCWDRDRLVQVVQNLLSNAIKYSPRGGEIVLRVEDGGREVRVSVTDQGLGIPADVLPQLFDRFYRTEAAANLARGLGLGLYITRGLVEAHGGRIWVESKLDQGSTFTFTLPYEASDGPLASPAPLTSRQLDVAALIGRGLTNDQIAKTLVITPGTAANHVQHIFGKLNVRTRAQIAAWAANRGLVAADSEDG